MALFSAAFSAATNEPVPVPESVSILREVAGGHVRVGVHGGRRRTPARANRDTDQQDEHREHGECDETPTAVVRLDATLRGRTLRRSRSP